MTFRPDAVEDFKKVFDESKHLIRGFEGCHYLELLQEAGEGNIFFTYSRWNHPQSLENYRNSQLFQATWARTKVLFAAKPEAWTVNVLHVGE
jgi:quinol monooxygenase YgiN